VALLLDLAMLFEKLVEHIARSQVRCAGQRSGECFGLLRELGYTVIYHIDEQNRRLCAINDREFFARLRIGIPKRHQHPCGDERSPRSAPSRSPCMNPIAKFIRFLKALRSRQDLAIGMARAAATAPLRRIDENDPLSWEFRGFSQHGEDGITDFLLSRLKNPEQYFVEIGIGDGTQNNTTWLVLTRSVRGLMIDGSREQLEWARDLLGNRNFAVTYAHMFVTVEEIGRLIDRIAVKQPDLFSLDIDGNDYWIVQALLQAEIRPKIWIVEYNSAFGPNQPVTIPYTRGFVVRHRQRGEGSYFGCSIAAWRKLFVRHGYHFVTVDSFGTNAFFIDPQAFPDGFCVRLNGLPFAECKSQVRGYGMGWEQHWKLIRHRPVVEV
jgi:hypothetical protein